MMKYIKRTKIGEIINLQRGFDLTKNEMAGGHIPVVGSNGIIGFHNQYTTKAPCLTIGRSGSVGKLYFSEVDSWAHNTTLFIENFKNNNPKYIYYLLKTLNLGIFHGGSVVPSLNRNVLYPLEIAFIEDLSTQQKIASVLSNLDTKIELNRQINTQLEQMAKLLYDYWFVQFDFPDAQGKPYKSNGGKMLWNSELKREIPEGWEVGKIENFGEFKNGINYDPSIQGNLDAKIINVRNISNSNIFISQYDLDTINLEEHNVKKYLVTENDILIARSGIPGATRMIFEYMENTIYCGFIIRFQVKDLPNKNYLFYSLKGLETNMSSKSGGTIMPNVNQDTLKRMSLILPNANIISKFNQLIEPIFKQLNNNLKETQELTALRDWLLPMLMNGQVRVG